MKNAFLRHFKMNFGYIWKIKINQIVWNFSALNIEMCNT